MVTFKQIQLIGFKSFADKTTIPLTEGVTCIVGPNGCGKSNVADAIRWVLGEQSAKMMRGSQMMDVIFGGTEKRRKMSFCEVTLTFDNTNRIFNVDRDEVEMTRRLYRDGTSEYLLNREPSRMRKLTELLHGAGAAKEGYSIIGQGRIEQIMNARPEDRRSIFEEATGIVVFKDRKAEVERKLDATKQNLYIFTQSMNEVERRLIPLKKEAENALKYRELWAEMRLQETNLYIRRHDSAEGEKEKLLSASKEILGEVEKTDAALVSLAEEYHNCQNFIAEADKDLQDLNERIRKYEVGIEHKSGEARLYTERAKAVKNKLASLQEELGFSATRLNDIEREINRTSAVNEKNAARIADIKQNSERYLSEMNELSRKISEYEYMTGEHRKKVLDALKDLSDIRHNMGSLSAQKEFLADRISEIENDMESLRANRDRTRAEYEEAIAHGNSLTDFLGNENLLLDEAEKKVADCDNKLQALLKQIYDARASVSGINSNLETYRALRDRFEGYTYSVQKLMSKSREDMDISGRIMGLIADVVSCEREYEVAIETAFGGAMQNVITRTRDDARYLIEYLKRTRSGQVTFLPVEALKPRYENNEIRNAVRDAGALGYAIELVKYDKKYENVIHNLLGNTLIVDNIQNATLIAGRYPRSFKIVTLDGDVIAVSGSMTGGSKRDLAGNLLANERRIKELEESLEVKRAFISRSENKSKELAEEKERATEQLNALQARLQDSRVELASITEKQSALLQSVTSSESAYAAYGQSVEALKSRLAALDSDYESASQGEFDLTRQSDAASLKMGDMSAEYDKLISGREEVSKKYNATLVDMASYESAVKAGTENISRLEKERENLKKKIAETNAAIPEINRQIEELNMQAERTALTSEEQAVVNALRRRISETVEAKKTYGERLNSIEVERSSNYDKKEKLLEKQHKIDLETDKITNNLETLRQRIADAYGIDYNGCLEYKTEDFEESLASSKIAQLRNRISALGEINHRAVEAYDETSARYEAMLVEKNDIEKAVSDLTIALDDIRAEMLKIFNEGFAVINENFKRTFKELFGGGKAEQLDYDGCDDPLNAGVEIIACPPGKKLTKISLLSGGERALTAIAILFAIIGMRPMPFCVLDEIEAALDEANVARYARYLKKFSEQTQFIVITHRKPTMENSDVLFGVTMEEKGVSKIVSVKLSEVQERLGGDSII